MSEIVIRISVAIVCKKGRCNAGCLPCKIVCKSSESGSFCMRSGTGKNGVFYVFVSKCNVPALYGTKSKSFKPFKPF